MTTDIWVPKGGTEVAKTNPAAFIRRTSNTILEFEATGADTSIRLIPLKEVMAEECAPVESHSCTHANLDEQTWSVAVR